MSVKSVFDNYWNIKYLRGLNCLKSLSASIFCCKFQLCCILSRLDTAQPSTRENRDFRMDVECQPWSTGILKGAFWRLSNENCANSFAKVFAKVFVLCCLSLFVAVRRCSFFFVCLCCVQFPSVSLGRSVESESRITLKGSQWSPKQGCKRKVWRLSKKGKVRKHLEVSEQQNYSCTLLDASRESHILLTSLFLDSRDACLLASSILPLSSTSRKCYFSNTIDILYSSEAHVECLH